MRKMTLAFVAAMMLMAISACKRDVYGDLFVKRAPVTFRVTNENGQALSNVSVKAEERDGFDGDLIMNGERYTYTDAEGMATISDAACYDPSQFGGRTNGFVFTTTGYAVFDTIFNTWEGTVDIVLRRE